LEQARVVFLADENSPRGLNLRMTFEAKVLIALHQQLLIHRTMGLMTDDATFPHGFMLEGEGARLFAMTSGAGFIHPRHREAAPGFEDVAAVRVMALDAVHSIFQHGMMLRELELGVRGQMTLETGGRILARVDDELSRAARSDMLTAGTMTGFTTTLADHSTRRLKVNPRVRTRRKRPHIVGVTIHAGAIADVSRTRDFQRINERARHGGARIENQNPAHARETKERCGSGSRHQQRHIQVSGVGMGWMLGMAEKVTTGGGRSRIWWPQPPRKRFAWRSGLGQNSSG